MLEQSCIEDFDRIVSWLPGGSSFTVHNQPLFDRVVLPRFFAQTKHRSFQKLLSAYGFIKLENGPNKGGYHHPQFQRGRKDLLEKLTRPSKAKAAMKATQKDDGSASTQADDNEISKVLLALASKQSEKVAPVASASQCSTLDWRQSPEESFSDWKIELCLLYTSPSPRD